MLSCEENGNALLNTVILSLQTEAVKIPLASAVSLAVHFTFLMWGSLWKTAETLEKRMSHSASVFLC
jgi:hypothetical protein